MLNSRIINGNFWELKNQEINLYDTKTGLNRISIWSNLTPFGRLNGFHVVNKEELVIYGGKAYQFGKNGVLKFSLKQNSVFTENKIIQTLDTLFNPKKIVISDNDYSVNKTSYNANITENKSFVLFSVDNELQLWSKNNRRKLRQHSFNNLIKAFIGTDNSEQALVFEQVKEKNEGFVLRSVNFKTGISQNKKFDRSKYDFFNPISTSCSCFQNRSNHNEWFCSDQDDIVWSVNTSDLSIQRIKKFELNGYRDTHIVNFSIIPNSNSVLFNLYGRNYDARYKETSVGYGDSIYKMDLGTKTIKLFAKNKDWFYPISEDKLLIIQDNSLILKDVFNNRNYDIITIDVNKESKVFANEKKLFITIRDKKNFEKSTLLTIDPNEVKFIELGEVPYSLKKYFSVSDEQISYVNDGKLYTYDIKDNFNTNWQGIDNPRMIRGEQITVNNEGLINFMNKAVIDLKTLTTRQNLKDLVDIIPLKGKYQNKGLKVQPDWGKDRNNLRIQMIDLKSGLVIEPPGKGESVVSSFFPSLKTYILFSSLFLPDKYLVTENGKYVILFSSKNISEELTIVDVEKFKVKSIQTKFPIFNISLDSTSENAINIESLVDKKESSSVSVPIFYTYSIDKAIFKNYHLKPLSISDNQKKSVLAEKDSKFTIDSDVIKETIVTNGEENIVSWYYAKTFLRQLFFEKNRERIWAGDSSGNLFVWNRGESSPLKKIELFSSSEIVSFFDHKKFLYVLMKNSEIKIIDKNLLELQVSVKVSSKNEYVKNQNQIQILFYTPDGYFSTSKESLRNFHFVNGLESYPLSNYEVYMNRPDIILERLGFADQLTLNLYRSAFLKRLKRNGLKEQSGVFNRSVPQITFLNEKNIPKTSTSGLVSFSVETSKDVSKLITYCNGIPVVNMESEEISENNNIQIQLVEGNNKISIISSDSKGVKSSPISFEIRNTKIKPNKKVHFIGIGISKYRNADMNLNYADKDVAKLATEFGYHIKDSLVIDSLLNERATKSNIKALKERLRETDIDDTVILSFSGHGIIGEDEKFYFATHDMDFDIPHAKGLSYEEMRELLTDIPARKKLLLIDACHSGEVEKEKMLENNHNINTNVKIYRPENTKGSIVMAPNDNKPQKSFDLMRSLFFESDWGDGTYIISAASAVEYAYEGQDWNNGVFTYSVAKALEELGSDWGSNDSIITISELKEYVEDLVMILTNGNQKPTSRADNIEWDWQLN